MVNINQPSNQIKLTNVSIVRMKKGKKRFELACYKNKVLEWRNGTEKDLDEVLQIHQVFLNVSKGQVAPSGDLSKSFPKMTQDQIILEMLAKGELQVGDKERHAQLTQLNNEVISIVASKCVDPKSKRVYPPTMIEKALGELRENQKFHGGGADKDNSGASSSAGGAVPTWHGVTASKPAKVLALEAIKALVHHQPIPIARARMRLRVTIPAALYKKCKTHVIELFEVVQEEEFLGNQDGWECVGFVEPGKYKTLGELVGHETKGKGTVEVLDMADVYEGAETG